MIPPSSPVELLNQIQAAEDSFSSFERMVKIERHPTLVPAEKIGAGNTRPRVWRLFVEKEGEH